MFGFPFFSPQREELETTQIRLALDELMLIPYKSTDKVVEELEYIPIENTEKEVD